MVDVTSVRASIHVHLYYMFSYLLCNHIQIIILDMQSFTVYESALYCIYIYNYIYIYIYIYV